MCKGIFMLNKLTVRKTFFPSKPDLVWIEYTSCYLLTTPGVDLTVSLVWKKK